MRPFDVAVIGGGILGCFAARNLMRYRLNVALIEAGEDVCMGITRANSAVVYAGYDHHPGSLKASMTVKANGSFDDLCQTLDVPFSRCGSLMTAYGECGQAVLNKKLEQGLKNGVPGLRIISGEEARKMEPMLSSSVRSALYAPSTGTVNPWKLGIAAYENAKANGCRVFLNSRVVSITKADETYRICTSRGEIASRAVINCAGMAAVEIHDMLFPSSVGIRLDGADFYVFDSLTPRPSLILFEESETGKGITAVPCTEGNLLLDSPPRPYRPDYATTHEGLALIKESAAKLLPSLDFQGVIRSFGGIRTNPETAEGKDIRDFCILRPEAGFRSLIGVKTPGLTCANELGMLLAKECAAFLDAAENPDFNAERKTIRLSQNSPIVCQCEGISRNDVLEAIRRGAVSFDGVKHRVGCGMGPCQGSRCQYEIEQLISEARL